MRALELMVYMLGAILIVVVAIAIMLLISFKKSKHAFKDLRQQVDDEDQRKKEVARRRKVTPKMKTAVLERDDYTCQICGISKGFLNDLCYGLGDYLLLEVDHINSVANGGSGDDINNLQTLCWRCNRKKGKSKTNEEVAAVIGYGMTTLIMLNKHDHDIIEESKKVERTVFTNE